MSDSVSIIGNMSDPHFRRQVLQAINGAQGVWRVELCRYRPRRTDRQNRWYHPCFVHPFAELLKEVGYECPDHHDAAHEYLKAQFLKTRTFLPDGTQIVRVRSTKELSTVEFNDYLDDCARWLAQHCGIVVPEPNIYHEPLTGKERQQIAAQGETAHTN
jgi:hypothetical protein